jgi:hypothetical protein
MTGHPRPEPRLTRHELDQAAQKNSDLGLPGNTHRLDTEGHFRSDPSYLPELRDYLDTLLQTRFP